MDTISDRKASNSPKLSKVSMNLTEKDINNASYLLEAMNERSQASVVSKSLSLTRAIVEHIENGEKLLIEDKKGKNYEIMLLQ
mgnify:FL=1